MGAVSDVDLVVGAGTHRDTHTAAVCDGRGRVLSRLKSAATPDGYGELLAWAGAVAAGRQLVWAVEGTRHYGLGLARHLAAAGQQVSEITAPGTSASARPAKVIPSTPFVRPGSCWPAPGLARCGRMGTGKRCGY